MGPRGSQDLRSPSPIMAPVQLQHGLRYDFSLVEINSLRNDRDSDLKQIENAFKDPEEKNSSEGIVGKYEVY